MTTTSTHREFTETLGSVLVAGVWLSPRRDGEFEVQHDVDVWVCRTLRSALLEYARCCEVEVEIHPTKSPGWAKAWLAESAAAKAAADELV